MVNYQTAQGQKIREIFIMSFNRPPDAKHQEEGGGKYCILCSLQEASSYKCGQAYNLGIFLLSFFSFLGDCGADNIFEPLVSHKNTVYTCGVSIRSSLMPKWRLQRFKQNVPDSTLTDTDSMSVNFPLFSFFLSPSASVWGGFDIRPMDLSSPPLRPEQRRDG